MLADKAETSQTTTNGNLMNQITSRQLTELLSRTNSYTLVDFYADWCGPCQRMTPVLEDLQDEFPSANFVKIDTDEESDLMSALKIRSIPTLVVYGADGEVVDRWEGGQDADEIRTWLEGVVG